MSLVNGPTTEFACSNCDALLFVYWETRASDDEWKLRAENCPWCDESPKTKPLGGSRVKTVKASGSIGGASSEEGGVETMSTVVDGYSPDSTETIVLNIDKASENAVPIRRVRG